MTLQTREITKETKKNKEAFEEVANLYRTAFPKQEQADLGFIFNLTKKDTVRFHGFYDGDTFVGLAYTLTYKDMTYLWYLAITSEVRGSGYGSQVMALLEELYPDQRIVLNLDMQDENASDAGIRQKRKEFYLKNGYETADYGCIFNKNHLDVMTIRGDVAPDEFLSIFKYNFGPLLGRLIKPKILNE